MADTVNVDVLESGFKYYKVHLTNESDGTGESAVKKIDVSTLTGNDGAVVTRLSLIEAAWNVTSGYVTIEFDATTNDEMLVCIGNNSVYYDGGIHDPQSTGSTGDIILTTDGFADGDGYQITLLFRKKTA